MVFLIIVISLICLAFIVYIYYTIRKYTMYNKTKISFKESFDLTELPVVTFYSNNKKLNFLLDTGSNSSYINKAVLDNDIKYEMINYNVKAVGIEGTPIECSMCNINISYKDNTFVEEFCVSDFTDAFNSIKEESGVQVHGILGCKFFEKYKYIIDFNELTAYIK